MPPKEKAKTESTESTELQVFNLEKFSIAQLPEFQAKKEEIGSVIALNPIVEIIDNSTYELAKKSRTAVKTLRTGLEKEQADVKRKIKANILDVVDKEYDQLVLDVKKQESDRQTPITAYEAEAELKRQEKARLEQARIDAIKKEIEDYTSQWKTNFNLMSFDSITEVSVNFLESYTSFDATILQEFEALFPAKIEELAQYLTDKSLSLTEAELARLAKIRLEEEARELAQQKEDLAAKQKIADEAEEKAKKEREDFEKEKAEFAKKQAIAAKKETFENRKNILLDLGFQFDDNIWEERDFGTTLNSINNMDDERFENFLEYAKDVALSLKTPAIIEAVIIPKTIHTVSPAMHYGVDMEEKAIEAISDLVNPTVNVCTSLSQDVLEMGKSPDVFSSIIATPILSETTWEAIEKDFKSSAEKSYSKWLKDNYNAPTKI